jgi:hypothetical protein
MDMNWCCALELNQHRQIVSGSEQALAAAVARGADLRVYTQWKFEEHMIPYDASLAGRNLDGLIEEVIDFRETILIDSHHVAGITTLRQPLTPTQGFNGTEGKMSFFLYNMTGHQACANLSLDRTREYPAPSGARSIATSPPGAEKMSPEECFNVGTCAPCRNFIYDMEVYRFLVRDDWTELLRTDEKGVIISGSLEKLVEAFRGGAEIKLGVAGLNKDRSGDHHDEVYIHIGSGFHHTHRQSFDCGTHPLVRVKPAIPLAYGADNWDVAWLYARTDGSVKVRVLDPRTRLFAQESMNLALRWFAR